MSRSAYNESYPEPDGRSGTHVPIMRDHEYWMKRTPILYDIHVEENHVNRVMRQFGVYQQTPVPIVHSVEPHVHRYGIYSSANNSSFFITYHLALIRSIFAL